MELTDIKRMRKNFGLTQTELARLAKVSQSLVAKIEAGRIDPTFSKAQAIFSVLSGLSDKEEPTADQFMERRIISVEPQDSVSQAVNLMKRHQISQLPVLSKHHVLGIVSERSVLDILLRGDDITKIKVSAVLDEAPPVVSKKTPLKIILDLLKYSPLVLISESGNLQGIITKADILKSSR